MGLFLLCGAFRLQAQTVEPYKAGGEVSQRMTIEQLFGRVEANSKSLRTQQSGVEAHAVQRMP